MKVFIRTSELSGDKPRVVACYGDDSSVKDNAHGDGVTVLTMPGDALVTEREDSILGGGSTIIRLAEDWRQRAGPVALEAQATQRIDEAFPVLEQISALREIVDLVIEHGADSSQWPTEAQERKAEIKEKWNYVKEIRERARAHAPNVPLDPSSDKIWPRRLAKK